MSAPARITVSDCDWFVCAWCGGPLPSQQGQTRFDLFNRSAGLEYVCAGSCAGNLQHATAMESTRITGVRR